MDQDERSLRGRLIGTIFTLAVITVFLVMAVTSYCWFAENPSVTAGGMSVSSNTPDIFSVGLEVYPVTNISGNAFTFDSAVTVTEMPVYDPADINFSVYKKALVLKFTYSLHSDSAVTLDWLTDQNTIALIDNTGLSNAIQIRQASVADSIATAEDTANSFVTVTDGNAAKVTSLRYALSGSEGENTVWFVIEYSKAVMDYISDLYLTDTSIPETIHYINDIDFLFSMEGA